MITPAITSGVAPTAPKAGTHVSHSKRFIQPDAAHRARQRAGHARRGHVRHRRRRRVDRRDRHRGGRRDGKLVRDITVDARSQEHWDRDRRRGHATSTGSSCWTSPTAPSACTRAARSRSSTSIPLKTRDDLSMAYTPGVARVCRAIHEDPELAFRYTIKRNYVAVVSDGSAVLGLGDIGPRAAMPVMEGKAMLLKEFGGVDALPDLPRHEGSRRDRRDGQGDRARLRRHQPRGHLLAALLRDRGPPEGRARHPGLPRRPARDRGRRDGGALQRAQDHRQAPRGPAGRDGRARRRRDRGHPDAAPGGRRARSSAATRRARSTSGATTGTRCTR